MQNSAELHDLTAPMRNHAPATMLTLVATLAAAALSNVYAQGVPGPSLQFYGLIDAAVGRFEGAAAGVNARDRGTAKVDGGVMSTSHWGIRGTEDLGSGLTASFDLSAFVRNDTGSFGRNDAIPAPVNVAADPMFSRAAWIGLAHATWGRVRLGNVTSLMFINSVSSNAFGDSTVISPLNLTTMIGSPMTGGTGWANSLVYDSPVWRGVSASLAHGFGGTRR